MKHRICIAAAALLVLTGCGSGYTKQTTDLTAEIKNQPEAGMEKTDDFIDAQYRFTVAMMQAGAKLHPQENQLYAPYLAAQTLLMAADGAAGETRDEILAVFGSSDSASLDRYLAGWRHSQLASQLSTANSVWVKNTDAFAVKDSYLQTMHNTFEASVFSAAFDDATISDMNKWVSAQTDGAIPEIIQSFEPDEVLMLLSAGAFDAKWSDPFADNEVQNSLFYAANGTQQNVPFMRKEMDDAVYLETENAVGFMRNYKNNRYAFAALLPQDQTPDEYIADMTPEQLRAILLSGRQTEVDIFLPKFSFSQETDLKPLFQEMGIQLAYSTEEKADFSGISEGKLFLNRSVQRTKIEVNEGGTNATYALHLGAEESACAEYRVSLNKLFLFVIYDREYGLPVLTGTVQSLE